VIAKTSAGQRKIGQIPVGFLFGIKPKKGRRFAGEGAINFPVLQIPDQILVITCFLPLFSGNYRKMPEAIKSPLSYN
jgi:hypothetical protein